MATITIPYAVGEAFSELAALCGENLVGCPRRIEMREPDGRPARDAEDGAMWRQVVDAWVPNRYVRCFCAGVVDTHYGDGLEIVGARIRFTDPQDADRAWARITAAWEARRADLTRWYRVGADGQPLSGRTGRPVMGALIRAWERAGTDAGAEIWIVGQQAAGDTCGIADIPQAWDNHIPAEIRRLAEQVPQGVCHDEREVVR